MNIFRKKKFTVSEPDPLYKVKYLGNVQTTLMKGDGCVDKPTAVLWNNHVKTGHAGIDMKLSITASGLKVQTKEQGLTEYRAHRITYCIAHPNYPKLFVWVYRHEGKKMKVELRCHAVLCKTEEKAKNMAIQLHDKLSMALQEFMREKTRKQNTRLILQRTNSLGANMANFKESPSSVVVGIPLRKKMLSTGQNYRPPVETSSSAPKLGDIVEDLEGEEEHEELCSIDEEIRMEPKTDADSTASADDSSQSNSETGDLECHMYELEIGNDIGILKRARDGRVDSDDESSESGFSEQDLKELTITETEGECSVSTTANSAL